MKKSRMFSDSQRRIAKVDIEPYTIYELQSRYSMPLHHFNLVWSPLPKNKFLIHKNRFYRQSGVISASEFHSLIRHYRYS
jgi:hypothetical protein